MTDGHYELRITDAELNQTGEIIVLRLFMAMAVIPAAFIIFLIAITTVFNL